MLEGLVQHDHPLTLKHILDRMRRLYSESQVVTLTEGGTERATYAEVCERIDRLCAALASLGVGEGDRVATFAWNSQRHLEAYMGVPCMGAVLHTLNIRLFEEQLTYIANHAEDKVVLVDDSLVPVLEKVAPAFETVQHWIVMGDGDAGSLPNALRYEELIADQSGGYDYPELDDRAAAGLCYTSGTTGNPKGVLYSHRSNVLHALASCLADSIAISHSDRVMPVVPMFHANAWGLPHASTFVGADLVRPGSSTTTGTRSPGTASRRASSRCGGRGSPPTTTTTRAAARSSIAAGCGPGTSPRSTTTATSGSPTAPRT